MERFDAVFVFCGRIAFSINASKTSIAAVPNSDFFALSAARINAVFP